MVLGHISYGTLPPIASHSPHITLFVQWPCSPPDCKLHGDKDISVLFAALFLAPSTVMSMVGPLEILDEQMRKLHPMSNGEVKWQHSIWKGGNSSGFNCGFLNMCKIFHWKRESARLGCSLEWNEHGVVGTWGPDRWSEPWAHSPTHGSRASQHLQMSNTYGLSHKGVSSVHINLRAESDNHLLYVLSCEDSRIERDVGGITFSPVEVCGILIIGRVVQFRRRECEPEGEVASAFYNLLGMWLNLTEPQFSHPLNGIINTCPPYIKRLAGSNETTFGHQKYKVLYKYIQSLLWRKKRKFWRGMSSGVQAKILSA